MILNTVRYEGEKIGEVCGEKNGILKAAKNMLKEKFSVENISKVTGLSVSQIKSIVI